MSENHKAPEVSWRVSENSRPRSTLFWWLVAQHDALLEAIDGNQMGWTSLCETIARLGLTDTKGNLPTKRNARETWLQARKYVAKRRSAKFVAATPVQPSRLPAAWQPTRASEPASPRMPPPLLPPTEPRKEEHLSEHARATLAKLDRQIAHRDRFVNPPRKDK